MKTILLAGLALGLIACSGETQSDAKTAAQDAAKSAEETMEHATNKAAEVTGKVADQAAQILPAGREIELSGTMGCGHCNYQVGNSCSAALQTADGTVVIIDGISHDDDLYKNRFDQEEITFKGIVSYDGDQAHVKMTSDM